MPGRDGHGKAICPDSRGATFETDDFDDVYVTDTVVAASPDLIVSVLTDSLVSYSMAHPHEMSNVAQIWSLRSGRALKPADILDARTDWQKTLLPVAQAHLVPLNPGAVTMPVSDIANPGAGRS